MEPQADTRSRRLAPIGPGWTLLHIGPPKTGTTAVQDAASSQRRELLSHGVLYPGASQNHRRPALELMERAAPGFTPSVTGTAHADRLLAQMEQGNHRRAFLSAETFGMASRAEAERVLGRLGDQVHVLMGLRELAGYALSMWQQRIKAGDPTSLEEWIAGATAEPGTLRLPGVDVFSESDGTDMISRWAGLVGPERVTVVVLDRDRRLLFDTVEDLLDLPPMTLVAQDSNASLTHTESTLLRDMSRRALTAGISRPDLRRVMLGGVSRALVRERVAPQDERRTLLPAESVEHVAAYGARLADAAVRAGVTVLGDLDVLSRRPRARADGPTRTDADVPEDLVRAAYHGIVTKAQESAEALPTVGSDPVAFHLPPRSRWARPRDVVVVIDPRLALAGSDPGAPATTAPIPGRRSSLAVVASVPTEQLPEVLGEARARISRIVALRDENADALAWEWARRAAGGNMLTLDEVALSAASAPESSAVVTDATTAACVALVGARRVEEASRADIDAALGTPVGWYESTVSRVLGPRGAIAPAHIAFAASLLAEIDGATPEEEAAATRRRILAAGWHRVLGLAQDASEHSPAARGGDASERLPRAYAVELLAGALIAAARGASLTDAPR